jgi:hypothetical protein
MTFRHFLSTFAMLLAAPVSLFAERPNVVLILIDDISHFAVSAYGAEAGN